MQTLEIDDGKKTEASLSRPFNWKEEIQSGAVADWTSSLFLGFLVVSFWRGSWTLIDILGCDQPASATLANGDTFCLSGNGPRLGTAWRSYGAGNGLLIIALFLHRNGGWAVPIFDAGRSSRWITPCKIMRRFLLIYLLGIATVNIWRGIWYILDASLWPSSTKLSFWMSAVLGLIIALLLCGTASLLAPPAIFLRDGPSILPPPICVTLLASYRSITTVCNSREPDQKSLPKESIFVYILDVMASAVILPWGVVGFWRGTWYLMDLYLWGLSDDTAAVHRSIGYSIVLGLACLVVASEDVVQNIPSQNALGNQVMGRLRSLVLALGAVNFWRAIWYLWDEFMGGSTIWSTLLSHFIGVFGLAMFGCLSCITAPPTTLGVDAIAYEGCPDEPLFHNIPVPAEALFLLGIARKPTIDPATASSLSLVTDDSVKSSSKGRITSQSASHLLMAPIDVSVEQVLKARSTAKRLKSQFYRSR